MNYKLMCDKVDGMVYQEGKASNYAFSPNFDYVIGKFEFSN